MTEELRESARKAVEAEFAQRMTALGNFKSIKVQEAVRARLNALKQAALKALE